MVNIVWVDVETGEVLEYERLGAICIVESHNSGPDEDWLGDWLTKQMVHLSAEQDAAEASHRSIIARIAARRRYLEMAYTERLKVVVRSKMKVSKSKAKSVQFAFGRAGWRSSKATEVFDKDAAMDWATENCPEAVKHHQPTLLKSQLPGGVPGVKVVNRSVFSIKC